MSDTSYEPPSSAGRSDITLTSSDGVDFHLHLKHLEVACDLIGNMLESAKPDDSNSGPIELVLSDKKCESAAVLRLVSPFCYNVRPPALDEVSLELLSGMLEMADKWGMNRVAQATVAELLARCAQRPLFAYHD